MYCDIGFMLLGAMVTQRTGRTLEDLAGQRTGLTFAPSPARRLRLECASLLAVQVGDEFVVMPTGATGIDHGASIGRLVVDHVGPLSADGLLRWAPDGGPARPPSPAAGRSVR